MRHFGIKQVSCHPVRGCLLTEALVCEGLRASSSVLRRRPARPGCQVLDAAVQKEGGSFQIVIQKPRSTVLRLRQQVRLLHRWLHPILTALGSVTGNPQLLHLVDQGGALQSKSSGCAFGATDDPTHFLQRAENQGAFGALEGCDRCGRSNGNSSSPGRRQGIGKHTMVGEDYSTFDQVL